MSDIAIKIEGLGKRYRIGAQQQAYKTLREKLNETALAPFRAARHLLTRNGNGQSAEGKEQGAKNGSSRFALGSSRTETFWALKDVSFEVKRGEVVGIIGRNGAGKSTLLKILSRITDPTEGYADMHGRVASLLEVGTGFHPELTGRENIFLNGSILGMKRVEIKKKFDEIVAFAEIHKFIDTPVKYYSSGMYVRLAFAVAAHLDPEIMLVDEVLAVGDAAFQKKCLGKMGDVAREGRTVLFVSHNMQAVTSLCNRAVLLDQGAIQQEGESSKVVNSYLQQVGATSHVSGEQVWDTPADAPGNDQIRLHRISLLADTDNPAQEIHLDTPLRLTAEYWNLVPNTHLIINVSLYNPDGSGVFEDWSATDSTWGRQPFSRGLYRTVCRIPADLLNEGSYRIRILFFDLETTKHLYNHENAVLFSVNDGSERPVSWHGKFIGSVHPKLHWMTERLGT